MVMPSVSRDGLAAPALGQAGEVGVTAVLQLSARITRLALFVMCLVFSEQSSFSCVWDCVWLTDVVSVLQQCTCIVEYGVP